MVQLRTYCRPRPSWWRHGGRLLALAVLAPLGGCASLSQGQCLTGDWYEIGQRDGGNGLERSRLFEHQKACSEYGVRPDTAPYDAGRELGLRRYCTADRGFVEGRAGNSYRGVCPAPAERAFLAGFRHGEVIHEAQEALDDVERDIKAAENRLKDEDTTEKERKRLLGELHALRREHDHRHGELVRATRRHGRR